MDVDRLRSWGQNVGGRLAQMEDDEDSPSKERWRRGAESRWQADQVPRWRAYCVPAVFAALIIAVVVCAILFSALGRA